MLAHLGENLDIETLARQFYMSKYTFLKHFKRAFSMTPYQYFLEVKMVQAKKLLNEKKLALGEIAMYLGFSDQSHFSNAFKKYFDISPREFQKQMRYY